MKNRIGDKIREIGEFLETLLEMKPSNLDEYKGDIKTKAACERFVEKTIQAVIDLAYYIIRDMNWSSPESEDHVFDVLLKKDVISFELFKRLKDANGMRNFLAHRYGKVNDDIVFQAIDEELEKDINEFLKKVEEFLEENKKEEESK